MKGQSVFEYFITYGWVILIVIIVAAALYALGIFNPETYNHGSGVNLELDEKVYMACSTLAEKLDGEMVDWNVESDESYECRILFPECHTSLQNITLCRNEILTYSGDS